MDDPSKVREEIANHVKRRKHQPHDTSWRGNSELPTAEELMRREPTLFPEFAAPNTKSEYLERQYKTYRHEGIEPLRLAINSYRRHKIEGNLAHVYANARVRGYTFARQGAACCIAFSTEKFQSHFDWFDPDENRLKVGNLVALSNDHFQTQCLVGVVAARPLYGGLLPDQTKGESDWTPPRIDIFWARSEESVWDPAQEMVMVEAKSSYYEPVRYAMLGLQHAATEESRFDKYLVDAHQEDPNYETFNSADPIVTPPASESFDTSQRDAYFRMAFKELAIVQGPPGTGKTFTSVVALEGLARRTSNSSPPIIIAAHTNHALDQLLRECMKIDLVIGRLGSRTQDEEIEQRTLFEIAKNHKLRNKSFAHEKVRNEKIRAIEEARDLCFPSLGLVSAQAFRDYGILTQEQYESLSEDDWEIAGEIKAPQPPDGVEPGMEDEVERAANDLLLSWLATQTEEDRSHLYRPTQRVPGPTAYESLKSAAENADDSDFEDGPAQKVTSAPEERNRKLDGQYVSLNPGLTGSIQARHGLEWWNNKARQLLKENEDLYEIPPNQRGAVYRYLRQQLLDRVAREILRAKLQEHQAICDDIKVDRDYRSVEIIQREKIRILGCTTTGFAKYRGLISALGPKILLIEEAAETHEPNISSSLVPSLEQLILVGDHQQLSPSVNVQDMKDFGLDKSLFERLVKERVPFTQLQVQRRMAPPIREVVNVFYPNLTDHPVVQDPKERPIVQGVRGRIWWFQHRWPDRRPQTSSVNDHEARMIIKLYKFLVQNGLTINQVTILSFYKAQVDLIKGLLSKDDFFGRFRAQAKKRPDTQRGERSRASKPADWDSVVRTVDGFQGEQNEVVILSAVRSCSNSGFVSVENRAVVALSRAKRGMYVFGNKETLLGDRAGRLTWGKVFDVFTNATGEYFPLICSVHGKYIDVRDEEEWMGCKDGGCELDCDLVHCLENTSHKCELTCHPPKLRPVVCKHPCEKILPCKHRCNQTCGKPCKCSAGCDEPALKNVRATAPLPIRSIKATGLTVPASTAPSNFQEKYCGLNGVGPQVRASHPALSPVIHETYKRTTLDMNGSRVVTETVVHQHAEPLIDLSIPDEASEEALTEKGDTRVEPEGGLQRPSGEKLEEGVAEVEDAGSQDDWLIEL